MVGAVTYIYPNHFVCQIINPKLSRRIRPCIVISASNRINYDMIMSTVRKTSTGKLINPSYTADINIMRCIPSNSQFEIALYMNLSFNCAGRKSQFCR